MADEIKVEDQANLKSSKSKPFQSPAAMIQWQWRSILEELGELQRHLSDPSCPCILADSGEYCGPKHALGLHHLAKETVSMAPAYAEMLEELAEEALDQHNALKDRIVCGQPHKDEQETVAWSRQWRKRIEPIYYHAACKIKPAKLNQDAPKTFCKLLNRSLNDESAAGADYHGMASEAKNAGLTGAAESLEKIAKQEGKHYGIIKKIADKSCTGINLRQVVNLKGETVVDIGVTDTETKQSPISVKAIVDTGATYTSIPMSIIKKLNLPFTRKQRIETSDKRIIERDVYLGHINLMGEGGNFDVMAGDVVLLGVLVLEALGFKVNPKNHQLEPMIPHQYYQKAVELDKPQQVVSVAARQDTTGSVVEWENDQGKKLFQPLDESGKSLGLFDSMELAAGVLHQDKPEKTVQITGKCQTKDPHTCEFTIRRRGKSRIVRREVKTAKVVACHATGVNDLVKNARQLVRTGTCVIKKKAAMHQEPTAKITGSCSSTGCRLVVKGVIESPSTPSTPSELPRAIETVIDKLGKRGPGEIITDRTFAPGISTSNRYDMQFKVIDASDLIVSHDPFTFQLNPKYTARFQPRLRERLANQSQVRKIAAGLDPEKLLLDTKAIDTGSPIVNAQNYVLCGNGRVMALILAASEHPGNVAKYKLALRDIAPKYALSTETIGKMKLPVLVRVLLTKTNEQAFAEECNARPTIEASAIEKARTDAEKITAGMLNGLDILEGEPIEEALRSGRNKAFVTAFLSKLPENEQALLIDARGQLNSDGVRRMGMAIFVATFKGDVGLKLAAQFFEALDTNVKNAFNGILRALGGLAQAENLVVNKQRDAGYTIGADLAKAITVFSNLRTGGMSVSNYINQQQMISRELTPFQERVLKVLDEHSRSAKRIGAILSNYSQAVIDSPSPGQVSMIELEPVSKEQLFENAVKKVVADVESEVVSRRPREPAAAMSCGPICLLQPRLFQGYKWLASKLNSCNLSERDQINIFGWKPLRDFLSWAVSRKEPVQVCTIGMVPGVYQITIVGIGFSGGRLTDVMNRAKYVPTIKHVFSRDEGGIFTVSVPEDSEKDLKWGAQEIKTRPARREPAEQTAMFQKAKLKFDPLLTAIGCQIGVGCLASPKKTKMPVCTAEQKTKRESCIIQVKAKLPSGCTRKEWSKPQDKRKTGCYNPFSVCSSSVGCRLGRSNER